VACSSTGSRSFDIVNARPTAWNTRQIASCCQRDTVSLRTLQHAGWAMFACARYRPRPTLEQNRGGVVIFMSTRVRVEGNQLRFYAAHMATFRGQVEPLHGHNYVVAVECEGPLTDDAWVIDFGYVKQQMKALCDELDHT